MKIESFFIDGFKNIHEVNIELKKITAIVSLNNFGKSNILEAINFGINFIKELNKESKKKLMYQKDFIPINRQENKKNNFKFEITGLDKLKEDIMWKYSIELSWKNSNQEEPKIISEYLKIKTLKNKQKYTHLIKRENNSAKYKSSEKGRCDTSIDVDDYTLLINKLLSLDNLFFINLIKNINNLNVFIDKNNSYLNFEDKNFNEIIFNLQKNDFNKFQELKNAFIELFPNIEDIYAKKIDVNSSENSIFQDSIYSLFVKDKNLNSEINFNFLSEGSRKIFITLTKIIISNINNISLIAIEELENAIHPSLFRNYLQIINQILNDAKIIITSHSPYILNYLNIDWIYIGYSFKPGLAEFFKFKKSNEKQLIKDCHDFSMNLGDYIFSLISDKDPNDLLNFLETRINA